MSDNLEVLLVGCGYMGEEYYKVLKAQGAATTIIGNSKEGAEKFKKNTGIEAMPGGIQNWLKHIDEIPDKAILAVPMNALSANAIELISAGVHELLIEKPGGMNLEELKSVQESTSKHNAKVYVGYNRRFYSSVQRAKEIIEEDGGLTSFAFEFTEWASMVENSGNSKDILENWLLANSSHVIDLAFYLGGNPSRLSTYKSGTLPWHPSGSRYTGAGETEAGVLFSYQADWEAPGRWGVEFMTRKHRLILRPLETLKIQNINGIAIEEVNIDDTLDKEYKPGLYKQTESFLKGGMNLMTLQEHIERWKIFEEIAKTNQSS